MLDINYYLSGVSGMQTILKLYSKRNFKSLYSAELYFRNLSQSDVAWIKEEANRHVVLSTAPKASEVFKDAQMSLEEKKEAVLNECDVYNPALSFLEPKGQRSITVICPQCKDRKERAFVPEHGKAKSVICNHRTNCGFSGDFIAAYAQEYGLSYGKSLMYLAQELGIDFSANEVHIKGTAPERAQIAKPKSRKQAPKNREIEYMHFDINKKVHIVDYKDFLDKYPAMDAQRKFKMVVTSVYEFSMQTEQWGKLKYFEAIGITKKTPLLKDKFKMIEKNLGYLFKSDLKHLVAHLLLEFPKEDLLEFGVIDEKNRFKQNVQEGLIVIPNKDLYSNMCSGLKFRKTKLAEWKDKKTGEMMKDRNKEPELSHGRIANPLPYHLTRDDLANPMMTFRLFEGQKDLHSMPSKTLCCDIAIPGVNGISDEMLGLFKGRKVEIFFDQDAAGREASELLMTRLEKAGAFPENKTWNLNIGSDVNDVLQNGYIKQLVLM